MVFSADNDLETKVTLETSKTGVIDEPPFRMLIIGDWSGDGEKNDVVSRPPIEIDRDNFDEVMARLRLRLNLGDLMVEFADLDDFHPDQLFRRLPVFGEMRDLRRRLVDPDTFYKAAREVRSWFPDADGEKLAAETRDQAPPSDSLLDSILSKPSGGAPPPRARASSELSSLISELVRPYIVSVDENEQAGMLAAIDEATSGLMRDILHNQKFQALESAWRGLYFAVRRVETSTDLKIFILNLSKDELTNDLKSAGTVADSAFYRIAVHTDDDDAWAAVFGNYAFEPSVVDTATLIRFGQIASTANFPFVSHMRPDVLGIHSLAAQPDPRDWKLSGDTDAGKLWAALRDQPESSYVGMTTPRILARLPYGAETDPSETFSFEEFTDDSEHEDYLWTNSCFVAALLLAQSYSASGWEMARSLIQDIQGLPVHIYEENGETVFKPCAETLLTQNACERLMDFGLMPIISYKNTDHVKLARFQSIADPVTALKGRWR
ncbi:MAG: type VI secretion system contractile sheath large subunit [Saprospiraceae bacterium]|nr:type VI secretion system contractile sheath large subunit [Pyrinomonadaceae bacterium]